MKKSINIFLTTVIILGTSMVLNLTGCFDLPNDVIMPQWDVDLNVPLLKKAYTLEDIIKSDKEPNISIDPIDSLYVIQSDNYLSTSGISEFLQVC